ncbi:MAG: rRNA maturation RNase YbeY, partial [Mycoplasmoidaceae bacterium]|nr:rRNA maturation RNase YbeY [Mycoplasmoidaceae bacterium]
NFKIKNELFFDLSFVDKNQIKHINKKYRKVNNQTDVISFAFYDSKNTVKSPLLGEIFICFEIAQKQAKENN